MVIHNRMCPHHPDLKPVHVDPYYRFRFGRWESVCEHWRSHPGQLAFDFYG